MTTTYDNWLTHSEYVFGALLKGNIDPRRLRAEIFAAPYDRGFEVWDNKEELVDAIGYDALQSSHSAALSLNGAGASEQQIKCGHCGSYNKIYETCSQCGASGQEIDWVKVLENASQRHRTGEQIKKFHSAWERGKNVSLSKLTTIARQFEEAGADFQTMAQVEEGEVNFKKTGIAWIDQWNGGVAEVGVTNIAGRPKVGKTTLVMAFVRGWLNEHPEENIAVFTLEMTNRQFKNRFLGLYPDTTPEEMERVYLFSSYVSAEGAINKTAGIEGAGLMIVDFADLMVAGEVSETNTTAMYKALAFGSKDLGIPIVVLSQLSGSYDGGLPRPNHVRYSRLIEALVVMNLMLYVPQNDWFPLKDTDILPVVPGYGWVLRWFSRFETKEYAGTPIAISVEYNGASGWSITDEGTPESLEK